MAVAGSTLSAGCVRLAQTGPERPANEARIHGPFDGRYWFEPPDMGLPKPNPRQRSPEDLLKSSGASYRPPPNRPPTEGTRVRPNAFGATAPSRRASAGSGVGRTML
jgi:hypothetical protein